MEISGSKREYSQSDRPKSHLPHWRLSRLGGGGRARQVAAGWRENPKTLVRSLLQDMTNLLAPTALNLRGRDEKTPSVDTCVARLLDLDHSRGTQSLAGLVLARRTCGRCGGR